ncbi:MAG: hypothetical protein P8179_01990 [Candidatus Thiodiazotropha sp.]
MKIKSTKLLITAFCVLSLMLLDGCGGGGGGGDGGTSEFNGSTNALVIEERHISHEDTRPTMDAIAAGLDPYATLIDDTFHCHNWNDPEFSEADMLIIVSGNSYSTSAGSGTIQAIVGNDDYDIEFRGGPLDGEAVQVYFDSAGQYFYISPGNRPASCYQSGASEVRAQLSFKRADVNIGDYTCRDTNTGKEVTLVISDNGRYSLGNTQGSWQVIASIKNFETTVAFSDGALGGAEIGYYESDDSGISEFGYVTTQADGLFDNGLSKGPSKLNCWHLDAPVANPVYGAQEAPLPTPPAVAISGRYVRSVHISDVMDEKHTVSHFWFDANGYAYRGHTPSIGLDCNRTRPNGLPFCDTYQFDGSTLKFFSSLGNEVASYSAVAENGQLTVIGGYNAIPVRLATAADLSGVWTNLRWWNFGCMGGYCDNGYKELAYAFNDTLRFLYTTDGVSTLGVDYTSSGLGSTFVFGDTDLDMAGQASISGTTMTLVYDTGYQTRHFAVMMNDGHLAIDELAYYLK